MVIPKLDFAYCFEIWKGARIFLGIQNKCDCGDISLESLNLL